MAAYLAGTGPSLTLGDRVVLVNGATEANVLKTQQVAIAQIAGSSVGAQVTLHNGTDQTANAQVADTDADADYRQLLTEGAFAVAVPSGQSMTFNVTGPLLRGLFGTAPTTGILSVTR